VIAIVAPTPEAGIGALEESVASTAVSVTGELVLAVPEAIVKVAWATGPLPMTVVFSPKTTHVMPLPPLEQDRLLPAAVAAEPATTVTPVTSEAE
jgi:hypothetical protein